MVPMEILMGTDKRLRMSQREIEIVSKALNDYQEIAGRGDREVGTLAYRFRELSKGRHTRGWGRVKDRE